MAGAWPPWPVASCPESRHAAPGGRALLRERLPGAAIPEAAPPESGALRRGQRGPSAPAGGCARALTGQGPGGVVARRTSQYSKRLPPPTDTSATLLPLLNMGASCRRRAGIKKWLSLRAGRKPGVHTGTAALPPLPFSVAARVRAPPRRTALRGRELAAAPPALRDHRVRDGAPERRRHRGGGSALWWAEAAAAGGGGCCGPPPPAGLPWREPEASLPPQRRSPPSEREGGSRSARSGGA